MKATSMLATGRFGVSIEPSVEQLKGSNAFLFTRHKFRGRGLLYVLMLLPLVIPGIMLGISIQSPTRSMSLLVS